jgi:tRNA (guanine37-N1)-methyltransferase
MANYDILGNIAIVKFPENTPQEEKVIKAQEIMNQYKSVKTVLEKIEKVSGRLRTIKTSLIFGEHNLISDYKENGCRFKMNIETCYFSPRLANERMVVAKQIKKNSLVLVMFAGVAPFSIVIAKNSFPKKVISVELGKDCEKYALENIKINKVAGVVEHIQGDVKKVIPKLMDKKIKFDYVVMPRPNLKDTFIEQALAVSKKGTKIIYYGFSAESKKQDMLDSLLLECKELKRKVKLLKIQEAGDIAPYEHRYRIELLCL